MSGDGLHAVFDILVRWVRRFIDRRGLGVGGGQESWCISSGTLCYGRYQVGPR